LPGKNELSVHLLTLNDLSSWNDTKLVSRWVPLLRIRDEALKLLEAMRKAGTIGAPLDAAISLEGAGREDFAVDGSFARAAANPAITLVGRHASGVKCARCWKYFDDGSDQQLDARCRAVVGA